MEHHEAIRSQAAERYVAQELPPAERNAFEAHFFDCQECADEVRFELTFAANVRAVSRAHQAAHPPPKPRFWEKWLGWLQLRPALAFSSAANLALAACLALAVVTGGPQPLATQLTRAYFAPGPTKGAEEVNGLPAGAAFYVVRFPSPGVSIQSYSYEILNADGKREASDSLQAPAGGDESLYLPVPLAGLPNGLHTLVVRGGPAGDIVSWSKFRTSQLKRR